MSDDTRGEAKLRISRDEAKARITALIEAGEKLAKKYTNIEIPLEKRINSAKRFQSDIDFWHKTNLQLLRDIFTNPSFANEFDEIEIEKALYLVAEELLTADLDFMQSMIDRIDFIPQE